MAVTDASVNLVAAALQYAAREWAVFPLHTATKSGCTCHNSECESVGKHPRTRKGFYEATTDEKIIRSWWRTWPDANIGIATGPRSTFWALDVDDGGEETLEVLQHELGPLPATVEARTGSGGRHILFQYTEDVGNTAKRLGVGLDTRGDGGYIVAAPSIHGSGKLYAWIHQHGPADLPIAVAPEWLLERLRDPPNPPLHERIERNDLRAIAYARGAIESAAYSLRTSDKGSRNIVLNKEAYSLYGLVASGLLAALEVDTVLTDAATEAGLPLREIVATLKSARAGEKRPRQVPERERPPPAREDEPAQPGDPEGPLFEDMGVGDFFATAEDKIQWVMEPFIPKGAFVLVQGGPKSGKTWFGAWLAGECAKMGLRVAVVEEEGPKEVLRDRLKPFLPDPIAVNRNLRVLYKKRIRIDNPKILAALIEFYRGFDVIVLDPFIRLHGRKEKESDEMMAVLACVQKLMLETGAAVILIHHTKKNESWHRTRTSDAGLDDGRGSGTIASEADNVIAIRGVPPAERRAGQVRFIVENPGSRVGAEFDKRTAVIDLAEQAQAPFTWATGEVVSDEDRSEDEITEIAELIIDHKNLPATEKKAISGTALAKILKRNKKACLEAVRRLSRHGVLECVDGRYGPLYFKPETRNDAM